MSVDDLTTRAPAPTVPDDPSVPAAGGRLRGGALGLVGVLFMAVANAAPITAMTGNLPIAVAYGNGLYAPAGFLLATIVLTLFTVGFVAMARHITTAGAFYGFISHGLGQVWGMAAGVLATMAYVVFEGSIVGIFSYFAHDALGQWFGWDVDWLLLAGVCIAVIGVLGYFDISVAAVVLGVFLVAEVLLLGALAVSVLVRGSADGFDLGWVDPVNAFTSAPEGGGFDVQAAGSTIAAGSAAIGLFFAFWSWVGFETTAVYGEESRNPKKIVPRATLIAVVGLGLFYTFVSWMVIAGTGGAAAVDKSANNAIGLFTDLASANLGGRWVVDVYLVLIVSGSFACALAFHNAAARYMYAIGREIPGLQRSLGATHAAHGSPHIASLVQTVVTVLLTVGFYVLTVGGDDALQGAYVYEYGLLALMGTMAILIVQSICSVAVISYFHVKKVHPGNVLTTGVIPALGGLGMLYVVYLLFSNLDFAGGGAAGSPFFAAMPWIVLGVFLAAGAGALWLKRARPRTFEAIGRTVLVETLD
ncbi:amino acid permease [Modestobacter sp. I12A-02628]|uniref:APC family permease n=1 Tax=Goekera deserti TaxID=2497753 RepID=A0A7K3WBW9_9ACTN|nr:APC family permease [Goekera deserti]MPQ98376.1 amino acid permease [Goekera deserti]NDI48203.1 amino acid permease [Goekera deserti]NEL53952.1 APC family permease [Goekera deserti]